MKLIVFPLTRALKSDSNGGLVHTAQEGVRARVLALMRGSSPVTRRLPCAEILENLIYWSLLCI